MNLYHCDSELLKAYATGNIYVIAPDLEAAKVLARAEFQLWIQESWQYGDADDVAESVVLLERDLACMKVCKRVQFITGSS